MEDLTCPKCEHNNIDVKWHDGKNCGLFAKVKEYFEHLHYTCRQCEYEWITETIDVNKEE